MVSAVFQWHLTVGTFAVALATLTGPFIIVWLFEGSLKPIHFAVTFVSVLLTQLLSQSVEVLRLLYRPWSYVLINFFQSALAVSLILLFVIFLGKDILAYFFGTAVASLASCFIAWYKIKDYLSFSYFHFSQWPKLLKFGLPLAPVGIVMYVMSVSDRWFVQFYHGSEDLGLLAVAAKFSLILALFATTFRQAWWPIALDLMENDDGQRVFRFVGRLYFGACCCGLVVITMLSPFLVKFFASGEFQNAWRVVGVLCWQPVFNGYFLIATAGLWKLEKTYLNLPLMALASVVGILLNFLLVPRFGLIGAAVGTAISYFLWIIFSIMVGERFWKVGHSLLVMLTMVSLCSAFVALFILWFGSVSSTVLVLVGICLILFLIYFSFEADYREIFLKYLKEFRK